VDGAPQQKHQLSEADQERYAGTELHSEGPTPSRVWGDQWLRVSEKVIKGLNHQLTNRVASLEAVLAVFEDGGDPDPQMLRALSQETSRLNRLLQLYRLMPAEPFAVAEPVRLQDMMPQVLELHAHHSDLRDIPCEVSGDPDTLPTLVRPSALLRCLLVLLGSGAGNALRSGNSDPLRLTYGGDSQTLRITFEAPAPVGQLLFTGEGSLIHAARSALAHAHATVDASLAHEGQGDRIRYELTLPTLPEARRLEREALGES
jgi:hypothetical protein